MRQGWLGELELLIDRLHAIWAAGRDTPAKRREVKRLMTLCGEVSGAGRHEHGDDPLGGWVENLREMARLNPFDVHCAARVTEGITRELVNVVNGKWILGPPIRRPFPPAEAPDAARVCIDVIKLLIRFDTQERSRRSTTETEGSDYRRLAEFPRRYRDAIRKAAQRNKGVRRNRPPNQRSWLYCVPDVVAKHGDAARPLAMRGGTSKGPSGTTRDK
jgi:hypothetical protein